MNGAATRQTLKSTCILASSKKGQDKLPVGGSVDVAGFSR